MSGVLDLANGFGTRPSQLSGHQLCAGADGTVIERATEIERGAATDHIPQPESHLIPNRVDDVSASHRQIRHDALTERAIFRDEILNGGHVGRQQFAPGRAAVALVDVLAGHADGVFARRRGRWSI